MRLFLPITILASLVAPLRHAHAQAPASAADSAAVVRAIAAYDTTAATRDTAAVARWLAPAYRYFTSTGGIWPRERMLAFLADSAYRVERAERSELALRVVGTTAVVSSRWRGRGSYAGGSFDDDQRCSLVLVRQQAEWRLVAEHCTQIAEE